MRNIGPYEILTNGTRVAVKTFRGVVTGHIVALNGVVVHEIQADVQRVRRFGQTYKDKPVSKTLNPNYSFIYVL